jgi:type IV pilus assembly protein PilE
MRGFTLLELMMALAVAGILAALVYPSYIDNVRRSSRSDARAEINNVANALERFFAANRTYTADLAALGMPDALSAAGKYSLSIAAGPSGSLATSYAITAVPVPGEGQENDSECPSFMLNSAAQRLPDPAASDCW